MLCVCCVCARRDTALLDTCPLLPLVEVEALCEEQELLLALQEEVSGPGDTRLLGVLADVGEVQILLLEVISETHEVKVGGHVDECVGHDSVAVLRQNLVHKKVESDSKGQRAKLTVFWEAYSIH